MMKNITIQQITFGSYLRLACTLFLMFGIIFGLISLCMGIFGGNVSFNLGTTVYTGMTAGIINLFFGPLFGLFSGLIYGIITFLPFHFFLKRTKGITLKVLCKTSPGTKE